MSRYTVTVEVDDVDGSIGLRLVPLDEDGAGYTAGGNGAAVSVRAVGLDAFERVVAAERARIPRTAHLFDLALGVIRGRSDGELRAAIDAERARSPRTCAMFDLVRSHLAEIDRGALGRVDSLLSREERGGTTPRMTRLMRGLVTVLRG